MYTLTKQDIRALKNSDTVCFDYDNDHKQDKTQIRANVKSENSQTGFEQTHWIESDSVFRIYKDIPNNQYQSMTYDKPRHCFGWVSSVKYDEYFQTFLYNLKEGDSILLEWGENSDGYLRGSKTTVKDSKDSYYVAFEERLYFNYLNVIIIKPNGKRLSFKLENSICPDNSAKMIKF